MVPHLAEFVGGLLGTQLQLQLDREQRRSLAAAAVSPHERPRLLQRKAERLPTPAESIMTAVGDRMTRTPSRTVRIAPRSTHLPCVALGLRPSALC